MMEPCENTHAPLLRETLEAALTTSPISDELEQVVLWLIWLSLASVENLARILHKDAKTIWHYLDQLEKRDLIAHVLITEPGWPRRHHRYYVTDLGLYVLAARQSNPISVPRLVQSYPVARADLQARLASSVVHLTLSELVSRLLSECPPGYQLTSYQQPWKERYKSLDGTGHIFTCDAAFLLCAPSGEQYACYVRVDQPERLFSAKAERRFLSHLIGLRQVYALEGASLPVLLLISLPARFAFWADLLEELPLNSATTPLAGAITDLSYLKNGVYKPIWVPFHQLPHLFTVPPITAQHMKKHLAPFRSVLGTPATPSVAERFSQYFTLQHLLTQRAGGLLARKSRVLPRYVGDSLQEEILPLITQPKHLVAGKIATAFHQKKGERIAMAARLSLILSDQQKAILASLARHPYLSEDDLLMLTRPGNTDLRLLRRQLDPLIDFQLVQRFLWKQARSARDYRRHRLTEQGLRYLSTRHQLSPAYYLFPVTEEHTDRRTISPLEDSIRWTQRGGKLLRDQLNHTNGLYHCLRSILGGAERSGIYTISFWKSAREAVRWHRDPLTQKVVYARPDAELLYLLEGATVPLPLLIEYDHGTTFFREQAAKFEAYVDYQHETGKPLPPILVILHRERRTNAILEAISEVGAEPLQIILVPEHEMLVHGLLPVLQRLAPPA
jgi:hypothetical protein